MAGPARQEPRSPVNPTIERGMTSGASLTRTAGKHGKEALLNCDARLLLGALLCQIQNMQRTASILEIIRLPNK